MLLVGINAITHLYLCHISLDEKKREQIQTEKSE